jgi:hypothetical protein
VPPCSPVHPEGSHQRLLRAPPDASGDRTKPDRPYTLSGPWPEG